MKNPPVVFKIEYKIWTNAKKDGKQIYSLPTHRSSNNPNSLGFQVAKWTQLSMWGTGEDFEHRKWNIKDRYRTTAQELPDGRAKGIWASGS